MCVSHYIIKPISSSSGSETSVPIKTLHEHILRILASFSWFSSLISVNTRKVPPCQLWSHGLWRHVFSWVVTYVPEVWTHSSSSLKPSGPQPTSSPPREPQIAQTDSQTRPLQTTAHRTVSSGLRTCLMKDVDIVLDFDAVWLMNV
jgi:hypothetical protein